MMEERDAPNGRVHATCDDLRVRLLTLDVRDGGSVAGENVHARFCSHVPDL